MVSRMRGREPASTGRARVRAGDARLEVKHRQRCAAHASARAARTSARPWRPPAAAARLGRVAAERAQPRLEGAPSPARSRRQISSSDSRITSPSTSTLRRLVGYVAVVDRRRRAASARGRAARRCPARRAAARLQPGVLLAQQHELGVQLGRATRPRRRAGRAPREAPRAAVRPRRVAIAAHPFTHAEGEPLGGRARLPPLAADDDEPVRARASAAACRSARGSAPRRCPP